MSKHEKIWYINKLAQIIAILAAIAILNILFK